MSKPASKSLIVVAVALLLLAIVSTTSLLTSRIGFSGQPQNANFANPNNSQRRGTNLQNNGQNGNNSNGSTQRNGNFQNGGGGNFQRNGGNGFNAFSLMRTLGLGGQTFVYINLGIGIIGILLALFFAYGVWKEKRWGLNWGMVLAVIFLLGALPGLFTIGRFFNVLRFSENVLSVIASLTIIVMGILPSVRDSVS